MKLKIVIIPAVVVSLFLLIVSKVMALDPPAITQDKIQFSDGEVSGYPSGVRFPTGAFRQAGDVYIVEFSTTSFDQIIVGTTTNLDMRGYFYDNRTFPASTIGRVVNILQDRIDPQTGSVHFALYVNAVSTGSTNNIGGVAHFGGAVIRSSDTPNGRTATITFEARNDARGISSNLIHTGALVYNDGVAISSSQATYAALRVRNCLSSDGDCGTDLSTGTLWGLWIEPQQGGGIGNKLAIFQQGANDYNVFLGSASIGSATPYSNARLQLVQAGGAGVVPALGVYGGTTNDYAYIGIGRISSDYYLGVSASANQFQTGNSAGDAFIASAASGQRLGLSSGLNIEPALKIDSQGAVGIKIATQTIAAGNTVAADACGGLKRISSAGAVTTDTTNTFTAPMADSEGCIMFVCNTGANNITLDNNARFLSAGGLDVTMTPNDCLTVAKYGGGWIQTSALVAN